MVKKKGDFQKAGKIEICLPGRIREHYQSLWLLG